MMLFTCQRLIIFKLDKGNQNKFLKHPKIKWLDGGLEKLKTLNYAKL